MREIIWEPPVTPLCGFLPPPETPHNLLLVSNLAVSSTIDIRRFQLFVQKRWRQIVFLRRF